MKDATALLCLVGMYVIGVIIGTGVGDDTAPAIIVYECPDDEEVEP
tara:strand:+ start:538 stop:675 length:138 start_codon:yes stop_codon:yes gene_type:complete